MAVVSQNTTTALIQASGGTSMGSIEVCYQFCLLNTSSVELQSSKLNSFFVFRNL